MAGLGFELLLDPNLAEYCDRGGGLNAVPGVRIVAGMTAVLLGIAAVLSGIRGEGGGGTWVKIAVGLEE